MAQLAIAANARRNGVAERLFVAAALASDSEPYDLIVANIVPAVLIEHAAALCTRVSPRGRGGAVVLSGLFADDVPRVGDCYAPLLDCRPDVRSLNDWRCLSFWLE